MFIALLNSVLVMVIVEAEASLLHMRITKTVKIGYSDGGVKPDWNFKCGNALNGFGAKSFAVRGYVRRCGSGMNNNISSAISPRLWEDVGLREEKRRNKSLSFNGSVDCWSLSVIFDAKCNAKFSRKVVWVRNHIFRRNFYISPQLCLRVNLFLAHCFHGVSICIYGSMGSAPRLFEGAFDKPYRNSTHDDRSYGSKSCDPLCQRVAYRQNSKVYSLFDPLVLTLISAAIWLCVVFYYLIDWITEPKGRKDDHDSR
jgi:hypothetical protein